MKILKAFVLCLSLVCFSQAYAMDTVAANLDDAISQLKSGKSLSDDHKKFLEDILQELTANLCGKFYKKNLEKIGELLEVYRRASPTIQLDTKLINNLGIAVTQYGALLQIKDTYLEDFIYSFFYHTPQHQLITPQNSNPTVGSAQDSHLANEDEDAFEAEARLAAVVFFVAVMSEIIK